MTFSASSPGQEKPDQPEALRFECSIRESGDIRLTLEVTAEAFDDLAPSFTRMFLEALDPEDRPALALAIDKARQRLKGFLAERQAARARATELGERESGEEIETDEDDLQGFDEDLAYVLDKNAELYKRLAR